jgi:hypothetical protein
MTGFAGWLRLPRGPWRPVVQDLSEDDCHARLLRHAGEVPGPHKDLTVLPTGQDPNRQPTRRLRVNHHNTRTPATSAARPARAGQDEGRVRARAVSWGGAAAAAKLRGERG